MAEDHVKDDELLPFAKLLLNMVAASPTRPEDFEGRLELMGGETSAVVAWVMEGIDDSEVPDRLLQRIAQSFVVANLLLVMTIQELAAKTGADRLEVIRGLEARLEEGEGWKGKE
jgi:hypothetical protein